MSWRKEGMIFVPPGDLWWARGYAHLPTARLLTDKVIRVYFAGLDEHKYGRIGYVDLDAADPKRILDVAREPVLDLGELGTFEDCGVVPSCILERDGKAYCYYNGFQRTERVPYLIFIGRAEIDPLSGQFRRHARTPVLDRTASEPFLRGAPTVLDDGGVLRMWYFSCTRWSETAAKLHYNNVIRHATSRDGITWTTDERISLAPQAPDEYSVGRPAVVKDADGYHMWFSVRSHSQRYTIGYAHSEDGVRWVRDDCRAGLEKSAAGWDSDMLCYPNLLQVKDRWYLFYNGNGHGSSGFGYAVKEGALAPAVRRDRIPALGAAA